MRRCMGRTMDTIHRKVPDGKKKLWLLLDNDANAFTDYRDSGGTSCSGSSHVWTRSSTASRSSSTTEEHL